MDVDISEVARGVLWGKGLGMVEVGIMVIPFLNFFGHFDLVPTVAVSVCIPTGSK